MDVLMSSRRTIMDGEVVTFASGFEPWESVFGTAHRAIGPFEVSASREGVLVHRADCKGRESIDALIHAVQSARRVFQELSADMRGGKASLYPSQPTQVLAGD